MAKVRVPIAVPLTDRELAASGTFGTDTMLVNCYIETSKGKKYVVKRPGQTLPYTYNSAGATDAQGMTAYKDMLFAMGSNTLYRLTGSVNGTADGTAWTSSTSGPFQGRSASACVVFQDQIFLVGGLSTAGSLYLNDVWASPDGVNWTQIVSAAPWAGRYDHQVVVFGDTMYLIGGRDGANFYNDVWMTTDGVNWTVAVAAAPWVGRHLHRCVTFNQGIFLMGGQDSAGAWYNDVWFSADGITWSQQVLAATWSARGSFGCLSYGGFIWVAGGTGGGGVVATVYKSADGINWTNTGSLPQAIKAQAYTVYNNKMWFVGGTNVTPADQTVVYSTTDGATFATTASYGGSAVSYPCLVTFRTPISVNTFAALTMWLIGGTIGGGYTSQIYRATLNVAMPSSWAIGTAGATTDPFKFSTQNAGDYLVFKNTSDAWVFHAGNVQKITDSNFPKATVPGLVNLDDTMYVMDVTGTISGSDLSTPFVWNALNYLTADYESDAGICLAKYQNFLAAFKATTLQFFYDAGRSPGSPLLPYPNATCRVGCASAATVVPMENTIVFMAQTNPSGFYIAMLDGMAPTKISTPDVERILNAGTLDAFVYAYAIEFNGHPGYLITFKTNNVTMVYDFVEKQWHTWQTLTGYFRGVYQASIGNVNYLQDIALGWVYALSSNTYTENGVAITVQATGDIVDAGSNQRKFCSRLEVIGDRRTNVSPNTATISWSDDDYQTFSAGVTVDLSLARPKVDRCGSFRRRAHRITHARSSPFRVEAFELTLMGSP